MRCIYNQFTDWNQSLMWMYAKSTANDFLIMYVMYFWFCFPLHHSHHQSYYAPILIVCPTIFLGATCEERIRRGIWLSFEWTKYYIQSYRVEKLTFGLIEFLPDHQQIGESLITWPSLMEGHLNFCLIKSPPLHCPGPSPRRIMGPTIDRYIKNTWLYSYKMHMAQEKLPL